jgi:spermidine/putrescine transport system substrate-binding protein
VTWPLFTTNKPIKSGLLPERDATLKIYNWVAYVNQKCLDDFGKKYNCKVEVTTFNTMTEALAKLGSGQVNFDVFMGVTADVIGKVVGQQVVQPLNHSYLPNIGQAWHEFTNPFYDQHWQYTVPYTIYTTGIAWRKDHVSQDPYSVANGWAFPWQSQYAGKVAILDDYREAISLGLMKNGVFDLNTTSQAQITASQKALQDLSKLTNMHIDNNDYTEVPSGQIWIHHAWSGDIAAAAGYMPKGVPVDVVGYWFPPDGKGPVANDTNTVLRGAQNPVLAHLFLNYLLDLPNVLTNISYNGYMQPISGVTPSRLVHEGILPKSLISTVVLQSYFDRGVAELQLPVQTDLAWQQAWQAVSHGV